MHLHLHTHTFCTHIHINCRKLTCRNLMTTLEAGRSSTCLLPRFSTLYLQFKGKKKRERGVQVWGGGVQCSHWGRLHEGVAMGMSRVCLRVGSVTPRRHAHTGTHKDLWLPFWGVCSITQRTRVCSASACKQGSNSHSLQGIAEDADAHHGLLVPPVFFVSF